MTPLLKSHKVFVFLSPPLILSLVMLAGCQKQPAPSGMPALHPVTVTVKQDGQPLAGATVALFSDQNTWAVGGTTSSNGQTELRTMGAYAGAPAGTYKVCIAKETVEGGGSSDDPSQPASPEKHFDLVDQKFKSPETTLLEMTVSAGQETNQDFDIGKAIKKAFGPKN